MPRATAREHARHVRAEPGMRRVDFEADDVNSLAAPRGGKLDARHEADPAVEHARRASSRPAVVSWSVSARVPTPRAFARSTSAAGESTPSEK